MGSEKQEHQVGDQIPDAEITAAASRRSARIRESVMAPIEIEPRYLVQMAHLTAPATIWKYVEKAVTRASANLVVLDLEDSIPREAEELLRIGRANIIRALNELDWGQRLRFFRPRGTDLDPGHEDIAVIVEAAGPRIDGLVYPKVEHPDEIRSLEQTLVALESKVGIAKGAIRIELLIESVSAEERIFEIASASRRLVGLIFGSYDYWASLGQRASAYRPDHPLINQVRARIVKAAAYAGVPAIAEMTTNYPTRDKSETERRVALEEFRRDAQLAREYGFVGKWTGIPDQSELAIEIFGLHDDEIEHAVRVTRLFQSAETNGIGAMMIDGRMTDRANDRLNRNTLKMAYALGRLDETIATELGVTGGPR